MAYSNAAEQLEKVRRKATDTRQKLRAQSGTLKTARAVFPSAQDGVLRYKQYQRHGQGCVNGGFTDGEKDASQYRRFKIKTVEGANDFASMEEVLNRRLSRLKEGDEGFGKDPT